jgi:hypothetical protein
MSILDLQGMETPLPQGGHGGGGNSAGSNGNSCPSDLSVLLCDHDSGLSVTLC